MLYQASFQDTLHHAQNQGGADLIVMSPPYCDARTYENDVSWGFEDYQSLGDATFQALKPGGHCLLNVDAPVREWREGFGTERGFMPWKIMLDWAERGGFRVPDRLAYARMGSPGAYSGRFRNDWEPLFWFQRPGGDGYFDKASIAEESQYTMGGMTHSRKVDGSSYVREPTGWAVENGMKHRGTLWEYRSVGRGHSGAPDLEAVDHPARFPFRLASDVIQCFSPPGGLVCDPFLGGGTSLIAAFQHGRDFLGGDLFCKEGVPWVDVAAGVAQARWGAGALAMFGATDVHYLEVFRLGGGSVVKLNPSV